MSNPEQVIPAELIESEGGEGYYRGPEEGHKLCPNGHPNPDSRTYCAVCGQPIRA